MRSSLIHSLTEPLKNGLSFLIEQRSECSLRGSKDRGEPFNARSNLNLNTRRWNRHLRRPALGLNGGVQVRDAIKSASDIRFIRSVTVMLEEVNPLLALSIVNVALRKWLTLYHHTLTHMHWRCTDWNAYKRQKWPTARDDWRLLASLTKLQSSNESALLAIKKDQRQRGVFWKFPATEKPKLTFNHLTWWCRLCNPIDEPGAVLSQILLYRDRLLLLRSTLANHTYTLLLELHFGPPLSSIPNPFMYSGRCESENWEVKYLLPS